MPTFSQIAAQVGQEAQTLHAAGAGRIDAVLDRLDLWSVPPNNFYMRAPDGSKFLALSRDTLKTALVLEGIDPVKHKGEVLTEVDLAIHRLNTARVVDWAGGVGGWDYGVRKQPDGTKVLVTLRSTPMAPEKGDPELWLTFLTGLVGNGSRECDQWHAVIGWIMSAVRMYHTDRRQPGQLLIMSGAPNCGKTIFAEAVPRLFGGSTGNPVRFLTNETGFNADLMGSTTLVIDDESIVNLKQRISLTQKMKNLFFSEGQRTEAKGKDAIHLHPRHRGMVFTNLSAEDIEMMPFLREGILDKLMLIRAYPGGISPQHLKEHTLVRDLIATGPAFVYWLLHDYVQPPEWYNQRMGVREYHHPELLDMLASISPEGHILQLIDDAVFRDDDDGEDRAGRLKVIIKHGEIPYVEGTASQIYGHLANHWDRAIIEQTRATVTRVGGLGRQLTRMTETHPHRVSRVGQHGGTMRYRIWAPQK